MDEIIDKALWNHAKITLRLRSAILAPEGVDEERIKSDRTCEFGVWLFGPGLQYCGSSEYQQLKSVHKRLHEAAFAAFCHSRNGKSDIAKASIEDGDFKLRSDDMRDALLKMRRLVEAKGARPGKVKA